MRRLAVVTALLCVVMVVAGVAVIPATEQTSTEIAVALSTFALAFTLVGALVSVVRRDNPVGWLMLLVGLLMSIPVLAGQYAGHALFGDGDENLPAARFGAWLSTWMYVLAIGAVIQVLLVFPSGSLQGWRRRAAAAAAAITVFTAVLQALVPGDMDGFPGIPNPLGVDSAGGLVRPLLAVAGVLYFAAFVVAVISIFVRLRRAQGVERQQLKWFALAAALFVASQVVNLLPIGLDDSWIGLAAVVLSLLAMPLAIGLAVLRYRLYDIDVVINRTLVYGGLTATLAGVYLGSVLVLQRVLSPLTDQSDLAVAASTLGVAGIFRPARSRIQRAVDRRFYRRRYDAARTLDAFSGRLRHELDLAAVGEDLRAAVRETVQPAHVSLWLRS